MFHIVLYEPEIPPNTGNIIRLSVNTGAQLHLIHPLGFEINDKSLRRAGLDYGEFIKVIEHSTLEDFKLKIQPERIFPVSTKGSSKYTDIEYSKGDAFLFGPETRGLPADVLKTFPEENIIRIPMKQNSRSLNLSNAAAVIIYEAWRQLNFR